MKIQRLLFIVSTVLITSISFSAKALADLIPAEDFYRLPEFVMDGFNDAGDTMLVRAPIDGRMCLMAIDVETKAITPLAVDKEKDVIDAYWVSNDRIFFTWDDEGFSSGGIWGVDKDGDNFRLLITPARARNAYVFRYTIPINMLEDDPDKVLVINNERRQDFPDVYEMDVNNGSLRRVLLNPGRATGYLTDHNGTVRIANVSEEDGGSVLLYRESDDAEWTELRSFEEDSVNFSPIAFTADNKNLYVSSNLDRDTRAIYLFDLSTKTMGGEILADEEYDIGGVVLDPTTRELAYIPYQKEKPAVVYFNEKWAQIQAMVDGALPEGRVNMLASSDKKGKKIIVGSYSDRSPMEYYILDTEELTFNRLFGTREWINPELMAEQKPIRFKARDDVEIPGYLSMPPDWDGEPMPFILYPHGGPWARDTWGFDFWRQLMVSRGYGVLQVDFRASTGYGKEHLKSSFNNPEVMFNDVYDGLQWAIKEGYADPERVGIAGASGGGWKTLYMLGRYPDEFDFGINVFGVYDVALQVTDYIDEWDREPASEVWKRRLGDPDNPEDMEIIKAVSPITYIDNITQPLLVYHGERDINVHVKQSRRLRNDLKKRGNDPIWIWTKDEAHSFNQLETRERLFVEMDKLLQEMHKRWEREGNAG